MVGDCRCRCTLRPKIPLNPCRTAAHCIGLPFRRRVARHSKPLLHPLFKGGSKSVSRFHISLNRTRDRASPAQPD